MSHDHQTAKYHNLFSPAPSADVGFMQYTVLIYMFGFVYDLDWSILAHCSFME
jgi:hypothetical protein